jgi:dipeptidase D
MLKDLNGGHSGLNIKDGRGNALKLLGRLLNDITFDFDLLNVHGGSKPNAIPREASVVIATDQMDLDVIKRIEKIFNAELLHTDQVTIEVVDTDLGEKYTDVLKKKIIQLLVLYPCGVQTMSFAIDGLVESSLNIGVLSEKDGELIFESAVRSSVKSLKKEIVKRLEVLSDLVGGRLVNLSDYPEWAYNSQSMLQDLFKKVYLETTGKEAEIAAIHAGLECGFFAEKLTETGDGMDLDMISLGPNMANVHTPYEQLSLSSVDRTWQFLKNVLAEIK